MIDEIGFCFYFENHPSLQRVANQPFAHFRQGVQGEAVRQFSRPHPEKASGFGPDERVNLFEYVADVNINGQQGKIEKVLKDAVGTVERTVCLRVNRIIAATEVIFSGAGAGFKQWPFELTQPEHAFSEA